MEQPLPDSELVIATPERVSFDYQVAGLGTRAIAQLIDLLILGGILFAVLLFGVAAGAMSGSQTIGTLIEIIGAFIVIFGYFWVSEALWSGQTIGKKAFRLRAVGDRGEPLTFMQAGIRNVVRIVDFLPYGYGVGFVVMFANGKGKRLGDLAAGTIVVKDSDHVWLWQLPGAQPRADPGAAPPPPGAPPGVAGSQSAAPPPPAYGTGMPPSPYTPASLGEQTLRRIDPELRRFVSSYARRRGQLSLELRVQLASTVQPGLKTALPDVFAQSGPLAALDHLADLDRQ
jgi:uncharacterized RDD family membrane protein YckC